MAGDKTKPAVVFQVEADGGVYMCNTDDMIRALRWLVVELEAGQQVFGTMYVALRDEGFCVSGAPETPAEIDAMQEKGE